MQLNCFNFWSAAQLPQWNFWLSWSTLHYRNSVAQPGGRAIFAPKIKNSPPPPTGFGSRSSEGLDVVWTRIAEVFCFGAHPKSVKTFFCWRTPDFGRKKKTFKCQWRPFVFFWWSLGLGRKNPLNFSEDLYFWSSPDFDRKTASIEFTTEENLGQVRLRLHQTSKKSPPPPLRNPGYATAATAERHFHTKFKRNLTSAIEISQHNANTGLSLL